MTPPTYSLDDLIELHHKARTAAIALRKWIKLRYRLTKGQLPIAVAMTLAQLDAVGRQSRYYGYEISQAPDELRAPICAYLHGLRQGRKPRSALEMPVSFVNAHRRVIRAVEKAAKAARAEPERSSDDGEN